MIKAPNGAPGRTRPIAALATALALVVSTTSHAILFTNLDDDLRPRPTVEQACGGGRVGNTQMFAGVTASGCDLVGSFDHFECWGNGGRYVQTTFVWITTQDCDPNPALFNGG